MSKKKAILLMAIWFGALGFSAPKDSLSIDFIFGFISLILGLLMLVSDSQNKVPGMVMLLVGVLASAAGTFGAFLAR